MLSDVENKYYRRLLWQRANRLFILTHLTSDFWIKWNKSNIYSYEIIKNGGIFI